MIAVFKLSDDLEPIPQGEETLAWMAKHKAGEIISFEVGDKTRTKVQNGSLHRYIAELSKTLNEGGYDVGSTITVKVDFTPETVKEYMFHPIMRAMFPDIKSTKDLNTVQISQVYENLNRLTAEKFGISQVWPSRFNRE